MESFPELISWHFDCPWSCHMPSTYHHAFDVCSVMCIPTVLLHCPWKWPYFTSSAFMQAFWWCFHSAESEPTFSHTLVVKVNTLHKTGVMLVWVVMVQDPPWPHRHHCHWGVKIYGHQKHPIFAFWVAITVCTEVDNCGGVAMIWETGEDYSRC